MRPIDKGNCPQINGMDKTVATYIDWRADLIARIGYYCVYCNMALSHQLHVEHVVPKVPMAGETAGELLKWDNMLLACEKCNRAKSNENSNETIHYLPEYQNGLLVFSGIMTPLRIDALVVGQRPGLNATQQIKAQATIGLFEWQNVDTRGAIVDIRWLKRYNVQIEVLAARDLLEMAKRSPTYDANLAGRLVATQASGGGFFMLWFHEFINEPEVLRWLVHPDLFPGVKQSCFDPITYLPINNPLFPI
jgi:HNH endonuclease